MHDDDPLMLGLADLLARNIAGDLHRDAPAEDADASAGEGELVLPRPGLVVEGKRQLTRLIGSGSFGTVYEARQLDLDRLEAIKFLHERWMDDGHREVRTRFLEEARVMARMRGPHLVAVHDFGTLPGGLPFFVMERLEGKTLRARLREEAAVSLNEFFDIAAQLLQGLCEAHAHGVVHRDVKPENIFLAADAVKLLDFGLAKTSVAITATDAVMGTPLYMAPELVAGHGRPDARTDVYAAAAVMYEMLTGSAPFRRPGISRRELEHAVVHEPPAPLGERRGGIPAELEVLVLAGLAKRADDRPSTPHAMLERLCQLRDRWVDGIGDPSERGPTTLASDSSPAMDQRAWPEPLARPLPARRRRWAGLASVAIVLVLSTLGLAWLAWPPLPDLSAASGGVLITRMRGAAPEVERTHAALCEALGGDEPRPLDTVVELPVHCATLSRWHAAPERLASEGNAVGAAIVVHVDDRVLRVQVLERGRRLPVLADLPTLELPVQPGAIAPMAAVLRALLEPEGSSVVALPVLDPERDGFHWTLLAEWLRHYQRGDRDPTTRERLERLARCTAGGDVEIEAAYCDLARLLHALELPCAQAIDPLRALLFDTRAGGRPEAVVKLELARCLARSETSTAAIAEAEGLLEEVLAARPDEPCAKASTMSTVARIAMQGGDRSGTLRLAATLAPAELRTCSARTMVVRELLERAYVSTTHTPPRWCDAARDAAEAHALAPRSVEAVTLWAEASVQCPGVTEEERSAVIEALELGQFEPGAARVSVAFMRWVMTRAPTDALAVLRSHDDVPLGEVPMLEGTASSLREQLCAEPCAYELLERPKQASDRLELLRRLGLGDARATP